MADHKSKSDHYQTERQDAAQQNSGVDDAVNKAVVISPGMLSSPGGFGNTSFEGYDLNAMIDIVESANPATLESAATALVDARDAINEAANELSRNLGDVDWEGEAHTAFYTWGMNLTTTALALAGYADEVGTQVLAASSGLASVRKSMPPRDNRIVPKKVDDIPTPQRVEGNAEYTAAVTAEKNRQEAINQMYRLASFYTVSSGMMELAEEPVFPEMPSVGVPEPPPGHEDPERPPKENGSLSATADAPGARRTPVNTSFGEGRSRLDELPTPHENVDTPVVSPEQHVGTEIDSVGTLPPQQNTPPTTVAPPVMTGPGGTAAGPSPMAPGVVPPALRGPVGRTAGFGGVTGAMPARRSGTGPVGPVGRAAASGQAGGRGTGPMGRGVVGGVPKAAGQATGRTGGIPRGPVGGTGAMNPARSVSGRSGGAGRPTGGVVGGKPVTGAAPAAKGSRIPRGTVIGGEGGATAPRGVGERPNQRGVIGGTTPTAGARQSPRRPAGSDDGVVGTPTGRTPGARNAGHTPGGATGKRGSVGNEGSREKRSRRDERRDEASATD
ncbi:hypothetical protein ACFU6S_26270 [Streptomyces sp. NPDC057456]|uniref:WXG100 family type VII secretion target n=1 Tax=Streptomyces sp. NPDC057456 TaxID=3346139 RepID=UPI00369BA3B1